MTMTDQHLGEADTINDDVSDDATWIRALVDLLDDESWRQIRNNERSRLLRRYALTGTSCPPAKLGSLDAPESDADLGGDPGPDVDAGDDGVGVVDADEVGGVAVGEGGGDQQQEGDQQTHVSTNRTKS